jgi:hypothetical protein
MKDGNMRSLKRFLFSFFWVSLAACGGGGNEEPVVYRDDGVLVVDGREYSRRTQEEINNEFGDSVFYSLLNLVGKSGAEKIEIEERLRAYGLFTFEINCEFLTDENRCIVFGIAVPAEWGDQWRRAISNWHWVERESVRFQMIISPDV